MNPLFEDSLLSSANAPFIEELYGAYLQNPGSVPPEWHELVFEENARRLFRLA